MTLTELIAMRQGFYAANIEDGYDEDVAVQAATRSLVYRVMDEAAGKECLNDHSYWNTDTDYYIDFWDMPTAATWDRMSAAATLLQEAVGVNVHLCDCSHPY